MKRETILSIDRVYRYTLWREFITELLFNGVGNKQNGFVQFIGLNPSAADENKDDPTIRRCIRFAKAWGYGELCMTNLFAYRATSPDDMKRVENPIGKDNQHHLLQCGSEAAIVIAAWGFHGTYHQQDLTVKQWLRGAGINLYHLGLTRNGHPKHPLYVKADSKPIPYIP